MWKGCEGRWSGRWRTSRSLALFCAYPGYQLLVTGSGIPGVERVTGNRKPPTINLIPQE